MSIINTLWKISVNDEEYNIMTSTRKTKKYDVFDKEYKYLFSIGNKQEKHYKDKLEHYKDLDHNDEEKKNKYIVSKLNSNDLKTILERIILW